MDIIWSEGNSPRGLVGGWDELTQPQADMACDDAVVGQVLYSATLSITPDSNSAGKPTVLPTPLPRIFSTARVNNLLSGCVGILASTSERGADREIG